MIPGYNPSGLSCERNVGTSDKPKACGRPASLFAACRNLCVLHEPATQPNCTHGLIGTDRCAFCGQLMKEPAQCASTTQPTLL